MKIAILAPMRQELAPVVQACSLQRTTIGATVLQSGTVGDTEIVAATTGIGTAGATRATERLLDADAGRPRDGRGHRGRGRRHGEDR